MQAVKNEIVIGGEVTQEPIFLYEGTIDKIYRFLVATERRNGKKDIIPVFIDSATLEVAGELHPGDFVLIKGSIATLKYGELGEKQAGVKCGSITVTQKKQNVNRAVVSGTLKNQPALRETHSGVSMATATIITVSATGKQSYVNAIFWGKMAFQIAEFKQGRFVAISGPMCTKQLADGTFVYEVSAANLILEEGENDGNDYKVGEAVIRPL